MMALPAGVFLAAAAALGSFLGLLYLRGLRRKPVLIGTHLLLGAAGLEQMAIMLRGAPNGIVLEAGVLGNLAAGFVAAAMFSGLAAALLPARSRRVVDVTLATHASVGFAGLALFLAWASNL
jgi:hypothetical protein